MSTKVAIPQQRRSGPLTTAASESPTPTHPEDAGEGTITLTKCEATVSGTTIAQKLRGVKKKTALLHPTQVDIPAGSITAILGTAESGKSTLLKFMAGCVDTNLECHGVG
jgi:ABC-type bacteriocin/lantibiotic exporter with double-glycine peptidase domain